MLCLKCINQAKLHKLKTEGVVKCKGLLLCRIKFSQTGTWLQLSFAYPMGKLDPLRGVQL